MSWDGDQDGDLDLIVGQRAIPFGYGIPVGVQFWQNDGKGNFTDQSATWGKDFAALGMLTDGALADLDGNGKPELVLAGEWMPIRIFTWNSGSWTETTTQFGLENTSGFWKRLYLGDINGDGKIDLLAGNAGTNSRLRSSSTKQLRLAINDFDQNGKNDIVLTYYNYGIQYPLRGFSCSAQQVPEIKEKFMKYDVFASLDVNNVYGDLLNNSLNYQATYFSSAILTNLGSGDFMINKLPVRAQFSSVNDFLVGDYNKDDIEKIKYIYNFKGLFTNLSKLHSRFG